MDNSFIKNIIYFIDKLSTDYNYSNIEALKWIYLNIFYNHISKIKYSKEEFILFIKDSYNFKKQFNLYRAIDGKLYDSLAEMILNNYCFNNQMGIIDNITLKDMEEVYEALLKEDIKSITGSYYTPTPIVEFITYRAIEEHLGQDINEFNIREFFLSKDLDMISMVKNSLESIKIIDIACGGGAFLREAHGQIYRMLSYCYNNLNILYDNNQLKRSVLQNSIYGIDIQGPSADICKILLLMNIEKEINLNIATGDALINNPMELGLSSNLFDIVLGNPPYIGEKGNKPLFDNIREYSFGKRYYERSMDYFYFFIYRAKELLKEEGILGYITTNYFVTADGGRLLREFIKENYNFIWLLNLGDINIFNKAKGQHNMIFIARSKDIKEDQDVKLIAINKEGFKVEDFNNKIEEILQNRNDQEFKALKNSELYTNRGHIIINCNNLDLLNKIEANSNYTLSDLCFVNQGIVSGGDRSMGKGIFVLTKNELMELNLLEQESKLVKPFYKNSNIITYDVKHNSNLYILYIDDSIKKTEDYPNIMMHLLTYKDRLEKRREVRNGTRQWFALQWPRDKLIFESEKIIAPQRSLENTFAYSKEPLYASADIYYITKRQENISLIYILGILNSSLMHYYLFHRGKRKGKYLELYSTPLKSIPILYSIDKLNRVEALVKEILACRDIEGRREIQKLIDNIVFDLYNINLRERDEIEKIKT